MNATPTQTLLLTNVKGKVRIHRQDGTRNDVTGDTKLADSDYLTLLETADNGRKGSSCTVALAVKLHPSDVVVFKPDKSGVLDVSASDVFVVQERCLELTSTAPQHRPNGHRGGSPKQAHLVSYFPACVSLGQYFEKGGPPHYQILTPGGAVMVNPEVTAAK